MNEPNLKKININDRNVSEIRDAKPDLGKLLCVISSLSGLYWRFPPFYSLMSSQFVNGSSGTFFKSESVMISSREIFPSNVYTILFILPYIFPVGVLV